MRSDIFAQPRGEYRLLPLPRAPQVVALIVQMARYNPLWSRRRIANELAKLGYDVGKDAVAKYMLRPVGRTPRPPSQTWGTFIRTHAVGTIAIDFFTVPTATFGVLYAFFVLSLETPPRHPRKRHRAPDGRVGGATDRPGRRQERDSPSG